MNIDTIKQVIFDTAVNDNILKITIKGDYEIYDTLKMVNNKKVKLMNATLILEKNCKINISNDAIALIAILSFFSVIPRDEKCELIFPFDVSKNFIRSLSLSYILPQVIINCHNGYVDNKMFDSENDVIVCFGGGIDSTAAKNLFDKCILVHEKPMLEGDYSLSIENVQYVSTNIRQLFDVFGLPIWMSIFIVCLLYNSKYIVSGSQFSSSYLFDGIKYFPRINNQFYKVFEINDYKILPMDFLTEMINMKIVYMANEFDKTAFCSAILRKKCTRCTKCLRKYMEICVLDDKYMDELSKFKLNDSSITNLFEKDKLYFGCHFNYCVDKLLDNTINKQNDTLIKLQKLIKPHKVNVDIKFLERYYDISLNSYPDKIKTMIKKNLVKFNVLPMTENDVKNVENFKQQ